ncbi:MAG: UDP-N-acetylmuramate dehydrogenase [Oscillospiraceae bacterium]|nr:UDP-N-acetylmuramate dehydrogenase [Oscillospiraceae bacterium]
MDSISYLKARLQENCPQIDLRAEEPMRRHTSFRIGGPARLMALPKTAAEAAGVLRAAAEAGVTPFFMGNGSNLLVSDQGYDGFLIKMAGGMDDVTVQGEMMTAGSGILLSRLARAAQVEGLTGLEFAHGIPGSLGGGITMNAGAYGGELGQVIKTVICLTRQGDALTLDTEGCRFAYRESAFSGGDYLILGATLRLERGDPDAIEARMAALAQRRREKQPQDLPSAGSTFRRPEGQFAAALIDRCGLKGRAVGGAQVSEKHAGFIVNRGGATCDDVLRLIDEVRETVLRETGTELELEVKRL